MTSLIRSRWAAIGAAVAVTLGAGGLLTANAASDPSVFVAINPTRVLDTRIDVGLTDALINGTARNLDVTGTVPIVLPGDVKSTGSPVPDGATAIVANVTGISPSTIGFLSVRPGTATGVPSTSSLNFSSPGVIVPNSVTVELPTAGGSAGDVNLYYRGTEPGAAVDVLIDIVGYYIPGGAGTPGPKGDTGDTGTTGATGATGPRGFSAWDEIPSGTTVTGVASTRLGAHSADIAFSTLVQLPGIAPVPLVFTDVNMAADASTATVDDDAACTGSTSAPTAPAGKVCIYWYGINNAKFVQGSAASLESDRAFFVEWASVAAGQTHVWAVWAYTAP